MARDVCGLQAQDLPAARLAVRARAADVTAADTDRARLRERTLLRTWLMRGTLHLVATEDAGWLGPLYAEQLLGSDRRRRAQLGLDEALCVRATDAIRDDLALVGPLTRPQLAERLAARGIPTKGQAIAHLVFFAAAQGVICFGPDEGGKPTLVLLADWAATRLGAALPREEALATLARRYLAAYAPATPADFAAWSGLPAADVRAGWQGIATELLEVDAAGRPAWLLAAQRDRLDEPPPEAPVVRLLPAFDTYLLGYRGRDFAVPAGHARRVNAGGGLIHPTVVVDGQVAATWRLTRQRTGLLLDVEPFEPLHPDLRPALEAEAADVGRFLDTPVDLAPLPSSPGPPGSERTGRLPSG